MANHVSHASLPFPVKGARYTLVVPYLDADGDPTDPTTPDTERSIDGAAFADCTEEVSTISGSNGMGYITLTGDELNASLVAVAFKVASGPKATLASLYPRVLPVIFSGTSTAGAAGSITLSATTPPLVDDQIIGCIVRTTGGTGGGGGSGSLNNQARVITDYVASTRVASIGPNWETNPNADTTYEVLLTEMSLISWADVKLWGNVVPAALVSTRVDASVGAMAADVLTASAIATDAIGSAELATTAVNEIRDAILSDATTFAGASIAAIKAKTDNLPEGIKKNTALNNFPFLMVDSADHITAKTGLTITATRSIDGAAFGACANSASELSDGMYKINLDAADLNGDVIILKFTGTAADTRLISIVTEV